MGVRRDGAAGCAAGWFPALLSYLMETTFASLLRPTIGRSCGPAVDGTTRHSALSDRLGGRPGPCG
ncbi:hypothetical protein GCM10010974_25170 [Brevibacterium sediminis]|uniref:Uncharacterized protein n=1 Tax=Brevibacterium sediminis TaxID=1857024 RepID=A0ABQ1MN06_9MICO|nr:hypothetical protein GCM10010974_25170 [Brevibacterium sediminis]